jgi:hypothetical protein
MQPNKTRADLWMDLLLVAFLIAFNVAARLLPHAPGFLPVAASGLFAARYLRIPALAVVVPLLAMALSDMALPNEDWRITFIGFVAISIPALAGIANAAGDGICRLPARWWPARLRSSCSPTARSGLSGMYPLTWQGLTQC